jgi:hypothetical protein
MPFNEGIDEVVNILTRYLTDGGKSLEGDYGSQASSLAEEMIAVMDKRLTDDSPFGALWTEYRANPTDYEAELTGALEVMDEAEPELMIRMEGYYAAFQSLAQPENSELIETAEPEEQIDIEELRDLNSLDDLDDDDEYREENAYLRGNVEDHSTSTMYYEEQDPGIEPNQTEE